MNSSLKCPPFEWNRQHFSRNPSEKDALADTRNRGGYSSEFLVGLCRPVPQILTQFQTKIFPFPHPFSDLTPKIHTRFQTFVVLTKSRIGKIQLE